MKTMIFNVKEIVNLTVFNNWCWLIILIIISAILVIYRKHSSFIVFVGILVAVLAFAYNIIENIKQPISTTGELFSEIIASDNTVQTKINPVGNDIVIEQLFESKTEITGYPIGVYSFTDFPIVIDPLNKTCKKVRDFIEENNLTQITVEIKIAGSADGVRSNNSLYKGDLGTVHNLQYTSINNNEKKSISLIPNKTIMSNEMYALARAYQVEMYCKQYFINYPIKTNLATYFYKEKGLDYRKIGIKIIIKNAYNKYTKNMNEFEYGSFKWLNGIINSNESSL